MVADRVATPDTDRAEEVFGALAAADRPGAGRRRRRAPEVCGVGCGGPMLPGRRDGVAAQHPGVDATSPCAIGWPPRPGCRWPSTTTPRPWPSARDGWARPGGCDDYLAMVVSTGIGGGIVLDGRLLDGAHGNAGHIGHVVVEPDGRRCAVRRAWLPGGRGVRAVDRDGHRASGGRGAGPGAASHRNAGRPGGGLGGQPVGPRVGGGGRLGGPRVRTPPSSMPPRRRSASGPGSTSPGPPGSSRPGSGPTVRWSARRRWVAGRWPTAAAGRSPGR